MIDDELKRRPPRPFLPSTFFVALVLMGLVYAFDEMFWLFHKGDVSYRNICVFLILILLLSLGVAYGILRLRRENTPLLYIGVLIVVVVAAYSSAVFHSNLLRSEAECHASPSAFRYSIISDPHVTSTGYAYEAQWVDTQGESFGSVRLTSKQRYERGQVLHIVGRGQPLKHDDWSQSLFRKGITQQINVIKVISIDNDRISLLDRFRNHVLTCIEPARSPERSILAALVCGRTTELAEFGLRQRCADIGVSHLFAVSGSHLSTVVVFTCLLLEKVGIRPRLASVCSMVPCLGFVLFTGSSLSSIRSFLMSGIGLFSRFSNRRNHSLSILSLAACLMIAADPQAIFDMGFCLSFACVLSISIFSRYGECFFIRCHLTPAFASAISASLAAQIASVPIAGPVFGSISLVAPISNLFLSPLVSSILSFSLLLVPLALIAPFMLIPIRWLASSCVFLIDLFGTVPFSSIPLSDTTLISISILLFMTALFLVWPEPQPRYVGVVFGCIAVIMTGFYARYRFWAPPQVVVMDVGQADSILVRDGSSALLVDAGVDERASEALIRNHVYHLDAVVITHWDLDHYGGLEYLMGRCQVDRIIVAEGTSAHAPDGLSKGTISKIIEMNVNDALSIGSFRATMIWPCEPVAGDSNADSLCLRLVYRNRDMKLSVGLTGDSEKDQEHEYARSLGDVDVLKLGHHGSKVSVDEQLMKSIKPELCIASAGEGNRYGHPSKECRDAVAAASSRFLCTKDVGDITLTPQSHAFGVQVEKAGDKAAMIE